jgi:hypothetical protein
LICHYDEEERFERRRHYRGFARCRVGVASTYEQCELVTRDRITSTFLPLFIELSEDRSISPEIHIYDQEQ